MTVERPVASEPPNDRPGWRLKLLVLAIILLIGLGAVFALARADQGDAATAAAGVVTAICTVLAVMWKS